MQNWATQFRPVIEGGTALRSRSRPNERTAGTLRRMARGITKSAILALVSLTAVACGGGEVREPITPVPLAAPAADEPAAEEAISFLDVMSGQPTDIQIDGKPVGKTPITGYKVSAGPHEVTFVFSEDNAQTLSVTTEPNKGHTVKLDPSPNATGTIHGDEIKKDGDAPVKKRKKK